MGSIGPLFRCTKCGVLYNADHIKHGDEALEDKAEELRAAWYKAIDKVATPDLRPEQEKAAITAEVKACATYMQATTWKSWGVPDALVTIKDQHGHRLECRSHHPDYKESKGKQELVAP